MERYGSLQVPVGAPTASVAMAARQPVRQQPADLAQSWLDEAYSQPPMGDYHRPAVHYSEPAEYPDPHEPGQRI